MAAGFEPEPFARQKQNDSNKLPSRSDLEISFPPIPVSFVATQNVRDAFCKRLTNKSAKESGSKPTADKDLGAWWSNLDEVRRLRTMIARFEHGGHQAAVLLDPKGGIRALFLGEGEPFFIERIISDTNIFGLAGTTIKWKSYKSMLVRFLDLSASDSLVVLPSPTPDEWSVTILPGLLWRPAHEFFEFSVENQVIHLHAPWERKSTFCLNPFLPDDKGEVEHVAKRSIPLAVSAPVTRQSAPNARNYRPEDAVLPVKSAGEPVNTQLITERCAELWSALNSSHPIPTAGKWFKLGEAFLLNCNAEDAAKCIAHSLVALLQSNNRNLSSVAKAARSYATAVKLDLRFQFSPTLRSDRAPASADVRKVLAALVTSAFCPSSSVPQSLPEMSRFLEVHSNKLSMAEDVLRCAAHQKLSDGDELDVARTRDRFLQRMSNPFGFAQDYPPALRRESTGATQDVQKGSVDRYLNVVGAHLKRFEAVQYFLEVCAASAKAHFFDASCHIAERKFYVIADSLSSGRLTIPETASPLTRLIVTLAHFHLPQSVLAYKRILNFKIPVLSELLPHEGPELAEFLSNSPKAAPLGYPLKSIPLEVAAELSENDPTRNSSERVNSSADHQVSWAKSIVEVVNRPGTSSHILLGICVPVIHELLACDDISLSQALTLWDTILDRLPFEQDVPSWATSHVATFLASVTLRSVINGDTERINEAIPRLPQLAQRDQIRFANDFREHVYPRIIFWGMHPCLEEIETILRNRVNCSENETSKTSQIESFISDGWASGALSCSFAKGSVAQVDSAVKDRVETIQSKNPRTILSHNDFRLLKAWTFSLLRYPHTERFNRLTEVLTPIMLHYVSGPSPDAELNWPMDLASCLELGLYVIASPHRKLEQAADDNIRREILQAKDWLFKQVVKDHVDEPRVVDFSQAQGITPAPLSKTNLYSVDDALTIVDHINQAHVALSKVLPFKGVIDANCDRALTLATSAHRELAKVASLNGACPDHLIPARAALASFCCHVMQLEVEGTAPFEREALGAFMQLGIGQSELLDFIKIATKSRSSNLRALAEQVLRANVSRSHIGKLSLLVVNGGAERESRLLAGSLVAGLGPHAWDAITIMREILDEEFLCDSGLNRHIPEGELEILSRALAREPTSVNLRIALLRYCREQGDLSRALYIQNTANISLFYERNYAHLEGLQSQQNRAKECLSYNYEELAGLAVAFGHAAGISPYQLKLGFSRGLLSVVSLPIRLIERYGEVLSKVFPLQGIEIFLEHEDKHELRATVERLARLRRTDTLRPNVLLGIAEIDLQVRTTPRAYTVAELPEIGADAYEPIRTLDFAEALYEELTGRADIASRLRDLGIVIHSSVLGTDREVEASRAILVEKRSEFLKSFPDVPSIWKMGIRESIT